MTACKISFPHTDYLPIAVEAGEPLSAVLTLQNSPILFGCRTGICGTCLVSARGEMLAATEEEQEVLDILASGNLTARLACQIRTTGDIALLRGRGYAIAPFKDKVASP